jgi:hypothetical protein
VLSVDFLIPSRLRQSEPHLAVESGAGRDRDVLFQGCVILDFSSSAVPTLSSSLRICSMCFCFMIDAVLCVFFVSVFSFFLLSVQLSVPKEI